MTMSKKRMDPQVVADVLDRDRGACINCGSEDRIQIAHIRSRGARPDLRDDPANLCCLCYQCHLVRQHQQGSLSSAALEDRMTRLYGFAY